MTLKQKLKKTMEGILVFTPLLGSLAVTAIPSFIENQRYNSLSTPEKIQYLENKLNNSYYQEPPQGVSPQMGGAILALWYERKSNMQEELSKLEKK